MKAFIVCIACAALALPGTAGADEVKSLGSDRIAPIDNTVVSTRPDGKICKQILRTGSRLGTRQICKTREEWDAMTQDSRKATERKQVFWCCAGKQ